MPGDPSSGHLLLASADPLLPVCVRPDYPEPSESDASGGPPAEEPAFSPRTTDVSSPDTGMPGLGRRSPIFQAPPAEAHARGSAIVTPVDESAAIKVNDARDAVLNATRPAELEAGLRGVWAAGEGRGVTARGRIVNLAADDCSIRAVSLMQSLAALLVREAGSPEGKRAAADLIAWLVADPSCARALLIVQEPPLKIVRTFCTLVCRRELNLEIRRNSARVLRNLVEQSAAYAKELAVPKRLDELASLSPVCDPSLCVYFAETVVALERHLRGSEASTRVGSKCIGPLLEAISGTQETHPMEAGLEALKSLSAQSHCAQMIAASPVVKKICAVLTWREGSAREAAIGALAWLALPESTSPGLWQEPEGAEEVAFVHGLLGMLSRGHTETEVLALRLLKRHPNLVMKGAVGEPQLRRVVGILKSGNCSPSCQRHSLALLRKLVNEGQDPAAMALDGEMICTLVQHLIQSEGDSLQVRNLALELLQAMVAMDGGLAVIEAVIKWEGVAALKYLLIERLPEAQADAAALLALLRAVSRTDGGGRLVREEGIIPLLVDRLMDGMHGLDALDCLHAFTKDDPDAIAEIALGSSSCDAPILQALSHMLTTGGPTPDQTATHPLQVLALVAATNIGRAALVQNASHWLNLLLAFTASERDGLRERALDCMGALINGDARPRLTLADQSLKHLSALLFSRDHRLLALSVIKSSDAAGGSAAYEGVGIYAGLFDLMREEGIAQSPLGGHLLEAVVRVGSADSGACARHVLQHGVQEALWDLFGACAEGARPGPALALLREVREQEVQRTGSRRGAASGKRGS
eukprot:evm.model.scf_314EXC.11 EVM.evm.TU.scf_314EXC.11   scf_314EXC:48701-51257(-)